MPTRKLGQNDKINKQRLSCFGSSNCPDDYDCPLYMACGKALFDELDAVPVQVNLIFRGKIETKAANVWRVRSKK